MIKFTKLKKLSAKDRNGTKSALDAKTAAKNWTAPLVILMKVGQVSLGGIFCIWRHTQISGSRRGWGGGLEPRSPEILAVEREVETFHCLEPDKEKFDCTGFEMSHRFTRKTGF